MMINSSSKTMTIGGNDLPVIAMPLMPAWIATARDKGFDLVARVRDRYHLALRCHQCRDLSIAKVFTLRTAQPLCPSCLTAGRRQAARQANLTYLRCCDRERHYAIYRMSCGHEVRRQISFIQRVGDGDAGLRCEFCLDDRLAFEANARGWQLLGAATAAGSHYRRYRHRRCGHKQDTAVGNMHTGRFGCGGCGTGWWREQSQIYLMRFILPNSRTLLKVGYSKDPGVRLANQLLRHRDIPAEIVRTVTMPSGQAAIREEKRIHAELRRRKPDAVVPRAVFGRMLKVRTEIYEPDLLLAITELFDDLEARTTVPPTTAPED